MAYTRAEATSPGPHTKQLTVCVERIPGRGALRRKPLHRRWLDRIKASRLQIRCQLDMVRTESECRAAAAAAAAAADASSPLEQEAAQAAKSVRAARSNAASCWLSLVSFAPCQGLLGARVAAFLSSQPGAVAAPIRRLSCVLTQLS